MPNTEEVRAKEVYRLLKDNFYYYERVRHMPTVQGTVNTANDSPHTALVPHQGKGSLEYFMSTALCDLGLQVQQEEAGFRVIGIRNDVSTRSSDVLKGDLIISINGTSMNYHDVKGFRDASTAHWCKQLMTGKKGSVISLSVARKSTIQDVHVRLSSKRRYAELVETGRNDICAVRIDTFTTNTYEDVWRALRSYNPWNMRGVLLDIRGNGGGTVQSVVDVASLFVGQHKRILTECTSMGTNTHLTDKSSMFSDVSVGLLVDRESASASEVLVGSLMHHKESLVVGQKTFGKGSIQQQFVVPSMPDQMLKMTSAYWMTPEGTCIDKKGFEPHVSLDDVRLATRGGIDEVLEIAANELAQVLPKRAHSESRYRSAV